MIPELGQIALIIALCLAVLQASVPLYGAWRGDALAMNVKKQKKEGERKKEEGKKKENN